MADHDPLHPEKRRKLKPGKAQPAFVFQQPYWTTTGTSSTGIANVGNLQYQTSTTTPSNIYSASSVR